MTSRRHAIAIALRAIVLRARLAWLDSRIDAEECARDQYRATYLHACEQIERLRRRRVLLLVEHDIDTEIVVQRT